MAILGIAGRMGRELLALAGEMGIQVVGGVDTRGEGLPVPVARELEELPPFDVLLDFSSPEATGAHLPKAPALCSGAVVGTTGLGERELDAVSQASKKIPVVLSSNMSLGANLLRSLTRRLASLLADWDVEIVELHHRGKRDAPSGTALSLFRAVQEARPTARPVFGREGRVGERAKDEVGVMAVRGGGVPGDHWVLFLGPEESLTLSHRALSRRAFARGALLAAGWVMDKKPGLYSMEDVLAL